MTFSSIAFAPYQKRSIEKSALEIRFVATIIAAPEELFPDKVKAQFFSNHRTFIKNGFCFLAGPEMRPINLPIINNGTSLRHQATQFFLEDLNFLQEDDCKSDIVIAGLYLTKPEYFKFAITSQANGQVQEVLPSSATIFFVLTEDALSELFIIHPALELMPTSSVNIFLDCTKGPQNLDSWTHAIEKIYLNEHLQE